MNSFLGKKIASTKLLGIIFVLLSLCIWFIVYLECSRIEESQIKIAEQRTLFQAQAFSQNTLSIIKRINDYLLYIRTDIDEETNIEQALPHIDKKIKQNSAFGYGDIAFQTSVVDAKGIVLYTSIDPEIKNKHLDLSQREHIRTQLDNLDQDELFISKPVFGKVSQKWSIQFTRKIFDKNKNVVGVLVVSISPEDITTKNILPVNSSASIIFEDGSFLSRWPDFNLTIDKKVTSSPSLNTKLNAGNYIQASVVDKNRRIFGFYKIPEYKLIFTIGQKESEVLAVAWEYKSHIIFSGAFTNLMLLLIVLLLQKTFTERDKVNLLLDTRNKILSSSMENMNDALAIFDEKGKLIFFNQQFLSTFIDICDDVFLGQDFETLLKKEIAAGYWNITDNKEEFINNRIEQHQNGTTNELHYIAKEDRWIRLEEKKTSDGLIVTRRIDLTDLVKSKDEAVKANLAKSTFLATMSHELRTPMNGILGMVQLLQMGEVSKAERDEYVETIKSCGLSLLSLLNDVLDLSKIESGKMVLEKLSFNPEELLRETIFLYKNLSDSKHIELTHSVHDIDTKMDYVSDPMRVRQILSNLLTNAIKFTKEGGKISIDCTETHKDDKTFLVFTVTDSGIGISKEKLNLLFKPFSQIDSSTTRIYGGTGLGLSIVKNIAELLGGCVKVESEIGQGSKFIVKIEVTKTEKAVIVTSKSIIESHKEINTTEQNGGYILVVEDVEMNQKIFEIAFLRSGYKYVCVNNGQEAVEYLKTHEWPMLITMDVQMPVMDGLTATSKIREMEDLLHRKRTPIIATTANAFEEDRVRCLDVGMDDFISKPINVAKLLEKVKKLSS